MMKYQEPNMEIVVFEETLLTLVEVSSTDGVTTPASYELDM